MRDPKKKPFVAEPVGSEAAGHRADGGPAGAAAFGEGDAKHPLRGALLFGNDPQGAPRGSESIGNADSEHPLRGALLFGNSPKGAPTGSESFGSSDETHPLRGALLFGNDPEGKGSGSEAFGQGDAENPYTGALAFGAPQSVPERLHRDTITYDFVGRLLHADDSSLAGIRKDSRDRIRERVLVALQRYLGMTGERLRHGLNEHSIPWGRLKRDADGLDAGLAKELQQWYRKAPGEILGVGHVQRVLESTERMHSFELLCEWDVRPWHLRVLWNGEPVAFAESTVHKEHSYFIFKDPQGIVVAYIDALVPRRGPQAARMRAPDGNLVATLALETPSASIDSPEDTAKGFEAVVRDHTNRELFRMKEQRSAVRYFRAHLHLPAAEEVIGVVEDRPKDGKIRASIELDLPLPRMVAWGTAVMLADLAWLRRSGWPEPPPQEEATVESVEEGLGPRRPRRKY